MSESLEKQLKIQNKKGKNCEEKSEFWEKRWEFLSF